VSREDEIPEVVSEVAVVEELGVVAAVMLKATIDLGVITMMVTTKTVMVTTITVLRRP